MLLQQAHFPQIKVDSSMTHAQLQAWGWSCREMLGRFVGPLRKEDIWCLKDVRWGQVPTVVVRLSVNAAVSNYSLHLSPSACRAAQYSFHQHFFFSEWLSEPQNHGAD